MNAAKFDKTLKSPRQELLKDAMNEDLLPESNYWAREILNVEPDNLEAHYVLALRGAREPYARPARSASPSGGSRERQRIDRTPVMDQDEARRSRQRPESPGRGCRPRRVTSSWLLMPTRSTASQS